MSKTQWYTKSSYLLVALALVLSLWVMAVPMAGTVEATVASEYYVDAATGSNGNSGTSWADAWKTITYAVETGATNPGDVIHVADGFYDTTTNGEAFPIDFNTNGVSLIGAGGDTSVIDASNLETNILNIWADGVSISGFELRNARATWWDSTGHGIFMSDADDCHISNIYIDHLTQGTSDTMEPAGIFMWNGSDDNTFGSIEISGINSDYQPRGIWCQSCSGNQFTDINISSVDNTALSADSCAYGIHLSGSSGNTFDDITIYGISGGEWAEGIELCYGSDSNTFGDLSISNVYGDKYVYGILLCDSSDNVFASSSEIWDINAFSGCGIGIGMEKNPSEGSNRNTFESFDIHDTCYGFYISKSSDNLITKSNIHDNMEGVHLCSEPNECVGDALHCNNIYHNANYGVFKADPPDVDATGNWWGSASGPSLSPGSGDKISANVLYDPWLLDEFQYCLECGGIPRLPPAVPVPTVSHWGIVAMITLFAGLLVWTVRRRRLAS